VRHRVRRHVEGERHIVALVAWIARDSREVAFRFLDAVESSITSLRFMPGKGSPKQLDDPLLANMRSWAVTGFPNHLYEMRGEDVFVLAVVHGARQYERALRDRVK